MQLNLTLSFFQSYVSAIIQRQKQLFIQNISTLIVCAFHLFVSWTFEKYSNGCSGPDRTNVPKFSSATICSDSECCSFM